MLPYKTTNTSAQKLFREYPDIHVVRLAVHPSLFVINLNPESGCASQPLVISLNQIFIW